MLIENQNHYKYFNIGNELFVFDTAYFVLAKINEAHKYIIDTYQEKDYKGADEKIDNIEIMSAKHDIGICVNKGLFISRINMKIFEEENLGQVSITPVHKCNLRCYYCFANHGENYSFDDRKFSLENIDKALDLIYSHIFRHMDKIRIDFVGGGEPFLNLNVIEYIINRTIEMDKKTNKKTSIFICTNGTIMSEKILKIIDSPRINLGISLDGNREQQDSLRYDIKGEGTYNTIVRNINYVKQHCIHRNLKNIWALVVVSPKTNSLIEILKHHKQLGFNSIQMKLIRMKKNKDLSINNKNISYIKELYRQLSDFLVNEIYGNSISYLKMILNENDYFGKIIMRLIEGRPYISRCAAGRSKISVTANGDVFSCDSFVGSENMKLFNIHDNNFEFEKNPFYNLNITNRNKCIECWGRYVCGGDCPHNSFITNGNIYDPDPVFCEIQLYLIELAIHILYELSKNQELFKEAKRFIEIREKII